MCEAEGSDRAIRHHIQMAYNYKTNTGQLSLSYILSAQCEAPYRKYIGRDMSTGMKKCLLIALVAVLIVCAVLSVTGE